MLNWIVWNRTDNLYKMDLALSNLQRLICQSIQPINQPTNQPIHCVYHQPLRYLYFPDKL